jgi:hypothetical protein
MDLAQIRFVTERRIAGQTDAVAKEDGPAAAAKIRAAGRYGLAFPLGREFIEEGRDRNSHARWLDAPANKSLQGFGAQNDEKDRVGGRTPPQGAS